VQKESVAMQTHRKGLRLPVLIGALALVVMAFWSPVNADLVPFRDSSLAAKGSVDYDESNDSSLVPKARRGGGAHRVSASPKMAAQRVAATAGAKPGEPGRRNLAGTTRTPQRDKKPQPGQQGGNQTAEPTRSLYLQAGRKM
jgi:hypothetical protein